MFDDRMRIFADTLYNYIRQSPELVSMIDTVVTDHFLGPVELFDVYGGSLGPTKLKQARSFWQDQNVQKNAFYGQGCDLFIDGSSFGWHVSPSDMLSFKQKEALIKLKLLSTDSSDDLQSYLNLPKKLSYLAASTVEIKHNEYGELMYVQDAAGVRVEWSPEQVVHIKNMEWNGEIRGFAPLKAIIKEMVMMIMLKENILASMQNGGSPDNIIFLKGVNGMPKAKFERLRTALESFSHLKKSHGNMPVDTELGVIPMGISMKDMEYRELAMFIISEYALALGLPTSRVPFLMTGSGGSSNKGELSGNSEDSYQTKINARRLSWENSWNPVFKKAGFTFKFRRDNLQDDTRETQAAMQRSSFVKEVQGSLFQSKKKLKIQAHLALLSGSKRSIEEDDIEDVPEEDLMQPMLSQTGAITGQGGKNQPGKFESASKVGRDYSENKKKTATNNGRNS